MPKTVKPPRLAYRLNEAAAILGISRWVLQRLIRDGELEAVKVPGGRNGAVLIPAASLARFLEDNAQDPTRKPAS